MTQMEMSSRYLDYLDDVKYLIEDWFYTQDGTKGKFVPLHLFPKQRELVCKYQGGTHVLVNKPRQAGVSTVTAAYIAATVAMSSKDNPCRVIIVANKAAQAQDFLSKVKDFLSQVPVWIWGSNFDKSKEIDGHIVGKGSVKTLRLMNGSSISAVATSKDAVRGQSSPRIIVIDEAAHIDKVDKETMFASAMMALSSNLEGQMFLISTPNSTDQIFYKTYAETIDGNGDNKFKIHQMYFFQDPRYNENLKWGAKQPDGNITWEEEIDFDNDLMVEKFKKGLIPDSNWFRDQCAILHHDKVQINREILCKFDGSGNNVVDFEHISRHEEKYVCEPIRKECRNGDMWIFEDPIEDNEYAAFADVSTGDGEDYCSLQILNVTTGNQAAELKSKIKHDEYANIVSKYCKRYNAITDVDTTGGYGATLISDLDKLNFKLLKKDDKGESEGLKFSGITRPQIFQRFITYVEMDSVKIKSERLIAELKTFIWLNGRPDHMRGFNDDAITALAGAIWLYETAFQTIKKAIKVDKAVLDVWGGYRDSDPVDPEKELKKQRYERMIQNGVNITEHLWLLR